jgi:hypothetical protein
MDGDNSLVKCPKCANVDMVQKISNLSELAPPSMPEAKRHGIGWWVGTLIFGYVGVAVIVWSAGSLLGMFFGGEHMVVDVPIIFTVVLLLLPFILAFLLDQRHFHLQRVKIQELLPVWERAVSRWNKLQYCSRDKGAYDPDERIFVPLDQISYYLYRSE